MRQIMLDTETTGLDPKSGHRVIEIGCVEVDNRRITGNTFHEYIKPDIAVDQGAFKVHGISDEFLSDKPAFSEVLEPFLEFIRGAELVIHNAPFDIGFLDNELRLVGSSVKRIEDIATVTDSLLLARAMHPGQKNSLDALCKRYEVDNSKRTYHGALLDSEILATVYLSMTGGQSSLSLDASDTPNPAVVQKASTDFKPMSANLVVKRASDDELAAHDKRLAKIAEVNEEPTVWQNLEATPNETAD